MGGRGGGWGRGQTGGRRRGEGRGVEKQVGVRDTGRRGERLEGVGEGHGSGCSCFGEGGSEARRGEARRGEAKGGEAKGGLAQARLGLGAGVGAGAGGVVWGVAVEGCERGVFGV